MVLICLFLCRSVSMSSLLFPFLVLCLCPNPHFHFLHRSSINLFSLFPSRLHPLPVFQSRRVPPALALPLLFFFPSSSSSGPSISPLLLLLSGLYFSAPDVPPVANIVFLPPPLDMAKEAICALLAILGHFFEAFSPLDLFFAPSPFRPVPRPFPAFLHPGCRRFPPLRLPSLSLAPLHRRAHQAPFCARGLLKNIAVSENAPGAHRDVPRAGGCSTDGRWR